MPASGKNLGQGFRSPGGLKHLDRLGHGSLSPMARYLYPYAWRDVSFMKDDFIGDTIDLNTWTTNGGTGTTPFAIPGTPGSSGTIVGATGTDGTASNRVANLYGAPIWAGVNNCGAEIRFHVGAAVTAVEWGFGFIDTHTTITTAVVLVGDVDAATSLAAGMGDAALIYQDTAETLGTGMSLITLGSAPVSNTGAFNPLLSPVLTATTYFTARVQLIGNDVFATVDDGTAQYATVAKVAGINGATLLRPMFTISGPTNTTKTFTIDQITVWQDRPA